MRHLLEISENEMKAFQSGDLSFVHTKKNRPYSVDDEIILEFQDQQITGTISHVFNGDCAALKKDYIALAVKVKKDG